MTGQSRGLQVFASIALVVMTCAGLASCGGSGSTPDVGNGGDEMTIMPSPPTQGAPPPTQSGPDLAVVAFFLASGVYNVAPGGALTFQARIRNDGNVASPATTLRFYRSRIPTIATDGTFLGEVAVGTIAASDMIDRKTRRPLTAPSAAGTYYYGACVDAVIGESDTTNNCSDARPITVEGLFRRTWL